MMGAMLSRFRVLDIDPPSKTDWVPRVLSMLQAEGLKSDTAGCDANAAKL
jgi:hypothetical protein